MQQGTVHPPPQSGPLSCVRAGYEIGRSMRKELVWLLVKVIAVAFGAWLGIGAILAVQGD